MSLYDYQIHLNRDALGTSVESRHLSTQVSMVKLYLCFANPISANQITGGMLLS